MSANASLTIARVAAPVMVQDGGRAGHLHEGVAPGGALFPELMARANLAVGNPWDAPALEAYGEFTLVAHDHSLELSVDGERTMLSPGVPFAVPRPSPWRASYAAVRGGIDVPRVLDGAGTLLVAGLGGHEGRVLRRGDVLRAATLARTTHAPTLALPSREAPVRVVPGPDAERFEPDALAVLLASEYTVAPASDRTGTRLVGPRVPRRDDDTALSTPMVRGAIQITSGGEAIVLGPDHPTTGGYPVLAVVIAPDAGALAARRPGATVRFEAIALDDARAQTRAWRAALTGA